MRWQRWESHLLFSTNFSVVYGVTVCRDFNAYLTLFSFLLIHRNDKHWAVILQQGQSISMERDRAKRGAMRVSSASVSPAQSDRSLCQLSTRLDCPCAFVLVYIDTRRYSTSYLLLISERRAASGHEKALMPPFLFSDCQLLAFIRHNGWMHHFRNVHWDFPFSLLDPSNALSKTRLAETRGLKW